jgi:hypothetical protein
VTGRTICMMEVDPRLIEIRKRYYERLALWAQGMQNAYPGCLVGMAQQQAAQGGFSGLLGAIGGEPVTHRNNWPFDQLR